jgi:hypothetical protein
MPWRARRRADPNALAAAPVRCSGDLGADVFRSPVPARKNVQAANAHRPQTAVLAAWFGRPLGPVPAAAAAGTR